MQVVLDSEVVLVLEVVSNQNDEEDYLLSIQKLPARNVFDENKIS